MLPTLAVVPTLSVRLTGPNTLRLTQKFADGMAAYAALWPGRVITVMHPDCNASTGNLDDREFALDNLTFGIRSASFLNNEILTALQDADVVMLGGDNRLSGLVQWCRSEGKKSVFVTEYSLKTRIQIINAEFRNPILRLRKYVWEWQQEQRNRRSVIAADAVQCNGTPTYAAYRELNTNTLLYLDNRISKDMLADERTLAARLHHLQQGAPLRLIYSGRLTAMKGTDDLIEVARHLRRMHIPFQLDIFGDGPLRNVMAQRLRRYDLEQAVALRGMLDFATELLPCVRENADLFVCCHRQGDPSCTYLETLACGVPIVGYANEALLGLTRIEPIGWTTPMNKPQQLARRIAELHNQRRQLADAATTALMFARQHTFEQEFRARIDQMKALFA